MPPQPVNRASNENGRTYKVLIADDSIGARIVARSMLMSAGYACVEATNGAEAFDMILRDSFDVLVTDLEMPQMDGFELIRALGYLPTGAARPLVVVCSGRLDDPRVCARPELRNAVGLVQKPATPETLLGAVQAALQPEPEQLKSAQGS